MTHEVNTELPNLQDATDRHLRLLHTFHGDIQMVFSEYRGDNARDFTAALSHSTEPIIFTTLMGYATRLGIAEELIRELFGTAIAPILDEDILHFNERLPRLGYISRGDTLSRFDITELNWQILGLPISSQPGPSEVGGTSFYTTERAIGGLALVVANNLSAEATPAQRQEASFLLGEADIEPVARTVVALALGESRRDIALTCFERTGPECSSEILDN